MTWGEIPTREQEGSGGVSVTTGAIVISGGVSVTTGAIVIRGAG